MTREACGETAPKTVALIHGDPNCKRSGDSFECLKCHLHFCYCVGCDDEGWELCTDCWAENIGADE